MSAGRTSEGHGATWLLAPWRGWLALGGRDMTALLTAREVGDLVGVSAEIGAPVDPRR
jgi:hypothetical protein